MIDFEKKTETDEQKVTEYLKERVKTDPYLMEKCKKTEKTIDGVMNYIIHEAKKQSHNGMACIPDEEVYQMAVHYILEDSMNFESEKDADTECVDTVDDWARRKTEQRAKEKSEKPKNIKKSEEKTESEQLDLFEVK